MIKSTDSILIVGNIGGTHIGGSLYHAAISLGITVYFLDADLAYSKYRLLNKLYKIIFSKPFYLKKFNEALIKKIREKKI